MRNEISIIILRKKYSKQCRGSALLENYAKWSVENTFLITIYKSFVGPHLDYGDVLYDQPNNESLYRKTESVHYNTALANTGVIKIHLR